MANKKEVELMVSAHLLIKLTLLIFSIVGNFRQAILRETLMGRPHHFRTFNGRFGTTGGMAQTLIIIQKKNSNLYEIYMRYKK